MEQGTVNIRSYDTSGAGVSSVVRIVVTLGLVVAACTTDESTRTTELETTTTAAGSTSSTNPTGACVDFEDLSAGTTFVVGDVIATGGIDVELNDFVWDDGTVFGGGEVQVTAGSAGGSGNELFTNNVLLRFFFPSMPLDGLSFDFGAHGGNLNIEINGDFVNFGAFTDVDGTTIGGVSVSVTSSGGSTGSVSLIGSIGDFAIGGQEFAIDNICDISERW